MLYQQRHTTKFSLSQQSNAILANWRYTTKMKPYQQRHTSKAVLYEYNKATTNCCYNSKVKPYQQIVVILAN